MKLPQSFNFVIMKQIFATIKELRVKNNKTQAQIAEILGLDTSAYGKLERGATDITLTKLEILANFYNMSVVELISYPHKNVIADTQQDIFCEEKVTLTIELKKEKKAQIMKLVFGDNNLEILNK